MGFGSYTAEDWAKLKESRKLSKDQSVDEVFKRTECDPKFDPKFIGTRECFDSEDHPNTTPIVVGLDVTGSMGYLATDIATGSLNELMMKLFSTGAVEDPAIMFAAYGDYRDNSPLQVTQFESDIRIAEQLLNIWFENRGQSKVVPTCLWHFLAKHTNIDAVKKRSRKGFVFTIGDDAEIRPDQIDDTIQKVIGDNTSYKNSKGVLSKIEKTFNVFHIMIGYEQIENKKLMPGHTVTISRQNIDSIPEIIISIIQLQNGKVLNDILEQWDEIKRPVIQSAVEQITLKERGLSL